MMLTIQLLLQSNYHIKDVDHKLLSKNLTQMKKLLFLHLKSLITVKENLL